MIRPKQFLFGVVTGFLILIGYTLLRTGRLHIANREENKSSAVRAMPFGKEPFQQAAINQPATDQGSKMARNKSTFEGGGRHLASDLDSFIARLKPQGQVQIMNRPDGLPFQVTGVILQVQPENWNALVQEFANHLVGTPVQLSGESDTVSNPSSETVTLRQSIEGIPVYGGVLRVTTAKDHREIYEISSDLKAISQVDHEVTISAPAARSALQERWQDNEIISLVEPSEPVAFASEGSTQAVLAWRFLVTTAQPRRQSREVLISAKTGEWLKVRSTQTK